MTRPERMEEILKQLKEEVTIIRDDVHFIREFLKKEKEKDED